MTATRYILMSFLFLLINQVFKMLCQRGLEYAVPLSSFNNLVWFDFTAYQLLLII